MKHNESVEMYLETILLLKNKNSEVHAVDVAAELDYSRASVSRAMKRLEDKGYIEVVRNVIKFTPDGELLAKNVYERHYTIKKILLLLGADEELAERDACRIEHAVSPELMELIKKHIGKCEDK
ncbi:MAG: metal-dependent transcriptional regulator [Clostridia bacterium]|nr:metal-dependent transcriptional regulator [Clostridia bacterium]